MFSQTQKPSISAELLCPAAGYSSRTGLGPSTIAAEELNCRVRDGNGCDLFAWATGHGFRWISKNKIDDTTYRFKSDTCKAKGKHLLHATLLSHLLDHQQSFTSGWWKHRTISMARLKTSRSLHLPPINLLVSEGPMTKVNLGTGFTLRCFQRLSMLNVATRRCPW